MQAFRRSGVVVSFLFVFILAATIFGQTTAKPELDAAKWRADLQYFATELPKRHKNLFHDLTREQFDAAVNKLDAEIPKLTGRQVAMEFGRIVSMVGDGHTRLIPLLDASLKFRMFPMRIYYFKEGICVQAADKEYTGAVGGRIVAIGGVPIEQVVARLAPYVPKENEMGLRGILPLYIDSPDALQAVGLIGDPEKVAITLEKDGRTYTVEMRPKGFISDLAAGPIGIDWVDARSGSSNPTPLWLKNGNPGYWSETDGFWYEYEKGQRLLYVQLNQVLDKPDKTLAAFMDEVRDFARANDVDKLVIDLRLNGGGNNGLVPGVIRPLIQLEKLDQKGHLFVLIGRRTFSAAQNLTNAIEKYTNAVFVGEPTGSHVNMFGDARRFNLPNSGLTVFASTLWHQDNIETDRRFWTAPQVSAALTFADYRNNIDTTMQAVLDYKPQPSLRDIAMELFKANDLKSFKAKALEFKHDPKNEYQGVERDINSFGYRLMQLKKMDEAIDMFKTNTELYPNSANAFDSLGEAYVNAGKRDEAIKSYEHALRIDPNLASAIDALRKLKGN